MKMQFYKQKILNLILLELCGFTLFLFFLDQREIMNPPLRLENGGALPFNARTGASFNNSAIYKWWNRSWSYRFAIEVNSTSIYHFWWNLDFRVNFTQTMKNSQITGHFDNSSVRVVEYDVLGNMIPYNSEVIGSLRYVVPSQFIPDKYLFNSQNNSIGNLYFHLTGETLANANRTYYVYFDTEEHGSKINLFNIISKKDYFGMTDLAEDFQYRLLSGCQNDGTTSGREYIIYNNQTEWTMQISTWLGDQYDCVGLYDWNQDGFQEIMFSDYEKGEMMVYTYLGHGSLTPFIPNVFKFSSDFPTSMALGDVDKDNTMELVVSFLNKESICIYSYQDTTPYFVLEKKINNPGNNLNLGCLAVCDLDKDGYPEIIGGTTTGIATQSLYIWEYISGASDYELNMEVSGVVTKYQHCDIIHCGDFDYDGNIEMVFAQSYNTTSSQGKIFVWQCTGPNSYQYEMTFDSGLVQPIVGDILDYEGDGKNELLISDGLDGFGTIRIFEYQSNGIISSTYEKQINVDNLITPVKHPLFFDFNNDGDLEVVLNGKDGRFAYYSLINGTTDYSTDYGTNIGGPMGQNLMVLGRRRNCDGYPTPIINIYSLEIKTADILLTIKDNDDNPINGSIVSIINATTGVSIADSTLSNDAGQVEFQDIPWNVSTSYNITIKLVSSNFLFPGKEILIYNDTLNVTDTYNIYTIHSGVWTINFNVTDLSNAPLTQGFVLVYNDSSWASNQIIANLSLNSGGQCRFQWTNRSYYNYSVYFCNPFYTPEFTRLTNDSTGIQHDGNLTSTIQFQAAFAKIRVNVIDTRGYAVGGIQVLIKINISTLITQLYTDASGDARDGLGNQFFYWVTSAINSNYTVSLNFYGADKLFKNASDVTDLPAITKNFTMLGAMDIFYNVSLDSSQYRLVMKEMELASNFSVAFRESVHFLIELNATSTEPGNDFNQRIDANSIMVQIRDFGLGVIVLTAPLNSISVGLYEYTLNPNTSGIIASKNYYATVEAVVNGYGNQPTPLVYTFNVRPVNTSIATQDTLAQSITSASTYWGQNISIYLFYEDTELSLGINDSVAFCSWDFGTYPLLPVAGQSGRYSLNINSSLADQVGTKTLKFYISKTNYASYSEIQFPVHILDIKTGLNDSEDFFEKTNLKIYRTQNINFTFYYFDILNSHGIENAVTKTYTWREFGEGGQLIDFGSEDLIEVGLGNYILDFHTETLDGNIYSFFISIDAPNYAPKFGFLGFEVDSIPLKATFSNNLIQSNYALNIPNRGEVEISVTLYDPLFGKIVDNANVTLLINNIPQTFSYLGNGFYNFIFEVSDYPAFFQDIVIVGKIYIQKGNYSIIVQDITFTVAMDTIFSGFPTFYFLLITAFSFTLIGIPLVIKVIRYASLPPFVKRINELKKLVEKQKLIVPSKQSQDLAENHIQTQYEERWKAIDLNFPRKNHKNHNSQDVE